MILFGSKKYEKEKKEEGTDADFFSKFLHEESEEDLIDSLGFELSKEGERE